MKTKKYSLIFVIITTILPVLALGRIEFYPSAEDSSHTVPVPALVGVDFVRVILAPPKIPFEQNASNWGKLKSEAEHKLEAAGINIFVPREGVKYRLPPVSILNVSIEMFRFACSENYVCRIQTFLSRTVNLPVKPLQTFRADVWKTLPATQAVSVEDIFARAGEIVLQQVETFIHAYRETNRQRTQAAVAEYKYVASKNGKVFHRPDCPSAKRILPENLEGFVNRAEAVDAGKRPCKRCKP